MKLLKVISIVTLISLTSGCSSVYGSIGAGISKARYNATMKPYVRRGEVIRPQEVIRNYTQYGKASWYGRDFHGGITSSGQRYNMYKYTAAHKTLPLGTVVRVKNLKNGKSVTVTINDRGPFEPGRIIDCSYAAAKKIGLDKLGVAPVKLTVIKTSKYQRI